MKLTWENYFKTIITLSLLLAACFGAIAVMDESVRDWAMFGWALSMINALLTDAIRKRW